MLVSFTITVIRFNPYRAPGMIALAILIWQVKKLNLKEMGSFVIDQRAIWAEMGWGEPS